MQRHKDFKHSLLKFKRVHTLIYGKTVDAAHKISVSGMAALVIHIKSIIMFTTIGFN
jgi:hypothetical protein